MFGMHLLPVRLDAQVTIAGTAGAPTIANGVGIKSITRLAAGTYQVQLSDNYYQFLTLRGSFGSPVTGGTVNMGSLNTGTVYQIVTLGTSTQANWVTAGVPSGITAAPGVIFKAAAAGTGSGTVKALGTSGCTNIELIGTPSTMMQNQPFQAGSGGYVNFQCLAPTNSSTTTPVATDPAGGSTIYLEIWCNNSSVQ